jgi:SnoaL-like domain
MPTIEELADEVAGLRRRMDSAESVLQIHELKARYGDLVDRRFSAGQVVDRATLRRVSQEAAALFTVDGIWDGGPGLGRQVGRTAIADRLAEPTLTFSRHLFVKPRLTVDGDRARGRWDLLSPCLREDGSSWWMCGYEDDEYTRVEGEWLHSAMVLTTVFLSRAEPGWGRVLA